jgi:hypothetical protein
MPRQRQHAIPVRVVDESDGATLLDASLALAQTQLVGQLADETSLDGRTMGTLGFTGALVAADIAAKDVLGHSWWTPLVGLLIAAAFCLRPALGIGKNVAADTDLGPGADTFYFTYGGQPSRLAREQLLADLGAAFETNAGRIRAKRGALRAALVILVAGLIGSAAVIELDRPSKMEPSHESQRHSKA